MTLLPAAIPTALSVTNSSLILLPLSSLVTVMICLSMLVPSELEVYIVVLTADASVSFAVSPPVSSQIDLARPPLIEITAPSSVVPPLYVIVISSS